MSVQILNGIGYGAESGAVFLSDLPQTTLNKTTNIIGPWAPWGLDNKLPLSMLSDIEQCGILNGIIDSQARLGLGEGGSNVGLLPP